MSCFFCRPRLLHLLISAAIHDSFHGVFVLCFYHMTVPSQSGLSYFATLTSFLMPPFLFLSFSETPSIHHSILISVLSSSPSYLLVTDQASVPYISTGLIIILYPFPFRYFGIFASHKTPARSVHFCQAALILFLTSCSQPLLVFITDPRFLNVSVCFNKFQSCPGSSASHLF